MKPIFVLGALTWLALVACSPPSPQANVRAFCRDYANNDPDVRRLREIGAGQPLYAADHQIELQEKLREAEQKCLVAHGAAVGGVQPVNQQWYRSSGPLDWLF